MFVLLGLFSALFHSSAFADWKISIQGKGLARGQAADPSQPLQETSFAEGLLFDEQGNYRKERYATYPGDITFRFLEVGNLKGGKSVDLAGWRSGTETSIEDEKAARGVYASILLMHPAVLVKVAIDKSVPSSIGEQSLIDPSGRKFQLKRDSTGDIVEISVNDRRYEYSDYTGQGELRHPGRIKEWSGGQFRNEITQFSLTSVKTMPAEYQLPTGYESPVERRGVYINHVAGDLYRVDGSPSTYHMAFAVGSEGIVLFDAPRSKQEGEAMRRIIAEKFPGKKVTDVVFSHGHIDHQAGLAAWLDMKPQIWTGVGGRAALVRHIPDASSASIQEISSGQELIRGNLKFRLLPIRSAHAHDMLVTLFPASRAVMQGDMFMVPEKGSAAAYPLAEQLQALLIDEKFEADHIISVHGRIATAKELAASVDLHRRSPTPSAKNVVP